MSKITNVIDKIHEEMARALWRNDRAEERRLLKKLSSFTRVRSIKTS